MTRFQLASFSTASLGSMVSLFKKLGLKGALTIEIVLGLIARWVFLLLLPNSFFIIIGDVES